MLKDKDFIRESIDKVLYERNYLLKELKKIDGLKVYETKSNFVLIYNENANEINESLIKIGIKVRSFTDENLKNFIRITVGSREQNIEVINCIKGDNYDYKEM
nr:aminotransferase class I/II-fold pyridoxal phosphate-dependent enzyme [Clostridium novyi]